MPRLLLSLCRAKRVLDSRAHQMPIKAAKRTCFGFIVVAAAACGMIPPITPTPASAPTPAPVSIPAPVPAPRPDAPSPTPSTPPFSAVDLSAGTGATAAQGRTVTVSYSGWLYDPTRTDSKGPEFDNSASFSFLLGVGRVIKGWDQGIVGMKVGGQRRLTIPPDLGYGAQPVGSIPPSSTLIFDVVLLGVS